MAKIPFTLEAWLNDKSQKVETRDGRPVRIICTDAKADDGACVVALIPGYGGEEAYQFFPDGRAFSSKSSDEDCADLFLVTPEEELTEFEKKLWEVLKSEGSPIGPIEKFTNADKEVFHSYAAKLFALAIDIRAKEIDEALIQSELDKDSIPYSLIEFMCNLYTCQNWKEIEEIAEAYVTRIKAASLKDLPRWKKAAGYCFVGQSIMYDDLGFYKSSTTKPGCRYITYESLRMLPGFNE